MASGTGANFEFQALAAYPQMDSSTLTSRAIAYKNSCFGQKSMQNHLSLLIYFKARPLLAIT